MILGVRRANLVKLSAAIVIFLKIMNPFPPASELAPHVLASPPV